MVHHSVEVSDMYRAFPSYSASPGALLELECHQKFGALSCKLNRAAAIQLVQDCVVCTSTGTYYVVCRYHTIYSTDTTTQHYYFLRYSYYTNWPFYIPAIPSYYNTLPAYYYISGFSSSPGSSPGDNSLLYIYSNLFILSKLQCLPRRSKISKV